MKEVVFAIKVSLCHAIRTQETAYAGLDGQVQGARVGEELNVEKTLIVMVTTVCVLTGSSRQPPTALVECCIYFSLSFKITGWLINSKGL